MKKILIISPHFPPSNLAAVHRSRLFAQHLPEFGWKPIILTVHENFYEEELDWNLAKLLPDDLQIEKVKAFRLTKPRIIGDIGLRGFFQLYKRAKKIIKNEKVDFLYIPIPSFYTALLGRLLHKATKIKYGIDYIDPWVHQFPGSDKLFSRHWFSTKIAMFLEPIAVKKAAIITGVAKGYYEGVIKRNPRLQNICLFDAMPYGGEIQDYVTLKELVTAPYLFKKDTNKLQLVYAGAMLPKAYGPLEAIFRSIKQNPAIFAQLELHFIGTGKRPTDPNSFNIKPMAEEYGIWETIVFEYPARIPYTDVLIHLNAADGVFILGSTEPHYTPSKVYQGVLSAKPILAVLHQESTAVEVIKNSEAGVVLSFNGEGDVSTLEQTFSQVFQKYLSFRTNFDVRNVKMHHFNQYSALECTRILANRLSAIN